MDDKDRNNEADPVILIRDRRTHREAELTSSDIMRILRKRAAKNGWRNEKDDSNPAG